MIDKKISLGTLITIATVIGTFIFTQGATSHRLSSVEGDADDNANMKHSVQKDVNKNKVDIGKIETKIDEWGKRLETLIIEN